MKNAKTKTTKKRNLPQGVYTAKTPGLFRSTIFRNGVAYYLGGTFKTPTAARRAYLTKKRELEAA